MLDFHTIYHHTLSYVGHKYVEKSSKGANILQETVSTC